MKVPTPPSGTRPYRMRARAAAAAATGERILDAAIDLFWERPTDQISLAEVARRASVTQQTVIRRFSGKDGLLSAAAERATRRVAAQRDQAPQGDLEAAVANLLDHYEEYGHKVLRLLAAENVSPALKQLADVGREYHREWCSRVFASTLQTRHGVDRERRLAQLVAVCDVQTWKLLRLDCRLSHRQTHLALLEMLEPITER